MGVYYCLVYIGSMHNVLKKIPRGKRAPIRWASIGRPAERDAGLNLRMQIVFKGYGGRFAFAKRFNIPYTTVTRWKKIPAHVCGIIHRDRPQLFTAKFCRCDLDFHKDGELKGSIQAGNNVRFYS